MDINLVILDTGRIKNKIIHTLIWLSFFFCELPSQVFRFWLVFSAFWDDLGISGSHHGDQRLDWGWHTCTKERVCNSDVPRQKIKTWLKFKLALKQTTLSLQLKPVLLFFVHLRQRKLVMYQIIWGVCVRVCVSEREREGGCLFTYKPKKKKKKLGEKRNW